MIGKCFSSYYDQEGEQCFSHVSILQCRVMGYLSCHTGDLFIEFQLLVNSDTKESEGFTY